MNMEIRIDRLETLATFLDTLPKEKFDFDHFMCGTAGCAIGWCPVVFKEDWTADEYGEPELKNSIAKPRGSLRPFDYADEYFGLNREQSYHLFMPEDQKPELYGGCHTNGATAPYEVAHNIREFIKKMVPQQPEVKREKIKPSISPDLLIPPIPKETEKIDRTETLESVLSDYSKALDTYVKGIDKAIDLVRDIAYPSYKRAREGNHFLTPEFFAGLYKREDIEIMEDRFQKEQKELK